MKYTVIFIYAAVSILLFFFNWTLFTSVIELDFGFGTFATLPFFVLQIFGALVIAAYMLWDRMKDLKREVLITGLQKQIIELQKDTEITALKTASKEKDSLKTKQTKETETVLLSQS